MDKRTLSKLYKYGSLEWTIRYLIGVCPGVINTRSAALEHLFLVVGNGYGWVNGVLLDAFYAEKFLLSIEEIEKRALITEVINKPYPMSTYSKICTVPDNVDPEWKAGIEEVWKYVPAEYANQYLKFKALNVKSNNPTNV